MFMQESLLSSLNIGIIEFDFSDKLNPFLIKWTNDKYIEFQIKIFNDSNKYYKLNDFPVKMYGLFSFWLDEGGTHEKHTPKVSAKIEVIKTDSSFFIAFYDLTQEFNKINVLTNKYEKNEKRTARFEDASKQMPIPLFMAQIEETGEFIDVNLAFKNFIGYNENKITHLNSLLDIIATPHHQIFKEFIFEKKIAVSEKDLIKVDVIDAYGNKHHVNLYISYKKNDGVETYLVFFQDVTSMVQNNIQLTKERDEAKKLRNLLGARFVQILLVFFTVYTSTLIFLERSLVDEIFKKITKDNKVVIIRYYPDSVSVQAVRVDDKKMAKILRKIKKRKKNALLPDPYPYLEELRELR